MVRWIEAPSIKPTVLKISQHWNNSSATILKTEEFLETELPQKQTRDWSFVLVAFFDSYLDNSATRREIQQCRICNLRLANCNWKLEIDTTYFLERRRGSCSCEGGARRREETESEDCWQQCEQFKTYYLQVSFYITKLLQTSDTESDKHITQSIHGPSQSKCEHEGDISRWKCRLHSHVSWRL